MSPVNEGSWLGRLIHSTTLSVIARLIVGGLMVYVSLPKLEDPVAFLKLVREYQVVPESMPWALNAVAILVPWIELLGGAALILGIGLRGTATVMTVMLIGFTATILMRTLSVMQADGIAFWDVKFDCGCGTGVKVIWLKLLENTGLILLTCVLIASRSRRFCLTSRGGSTAETGRAVAEPAS